MLGSLRSGSMLCRWGRGVRVGRVASVFSSADLPFGCFRPFVSKANSANGSAATAAITSTVRCRSFSKRVAFKRSVVNNDVIKNHRIVYPEIRVVFDDEATGKSTWKIMQRSEALEFAESKELDLVLVKAPDKGDEMPVCVLQDFKKRQLELQKKTKDEPKKKAKTMKQIRVGALCETHDFNTKMTKVKNFLREGLQVKLSIFAKKRIARDNPLAMDEMTLKVLEALENEAGSIQSVSKDASRNEFIVSPLKN